MTSEKLDRYIARYLRLSRPLFGPLSVPANTFFQGSMNRTAPVASDYDYDRLRSFAETEFDHRTAEIARIAARIAPLPEFTFLYLKSTNYQAQAITNLEKPLVLLDADLKTFFFLFFTARLCEIHYAKTEEDEGRFDDLCVRSMGDLAARRRFSPDDVDAYTAIFKTDENLTAVGSSLSCVACYYIIAHEIGHLVFDAEGGLSSRETELLCDRFAARVLAELRVSKRLEWSNVPSGYLLTPLVVTEIWEAFDFVHRIGGASVARDQYPPPRERRNAMRPVLESADLNDRALCRDLRLSIARLKIRRLAKAVR